MIVFAIFAETTTPTFVFRRKRRQVNCSGGAPATGAAVRFRATVRFATGRAVAAARAGAFGAAARVPAVFVAAARGRVVRAAGFFSLFSAIRLLRLGGALAHQGPQTRDLAA